MSPGSPSNDPPVVGDGSVTYPKTNACAWWLETGSNSSIGKFSIHIDAQDAQDFFLDTAGLDSWTSVMPLAIIAGASLSCRSVPS